MATTVVGLFEARNDAATALDELTHNSFHRDDIEFMEGRSNGELLKSRLTEHGVPTRDAGLYASGVAGGDTLVVVHTNDARGDLAQNILNRHGAIDIYDAEVVRTEITHSNSASIAAPVGALGAAAVAASGVASPPLPPVSSAPLTSTSSTSSTVENVPAGSEVVVPIVEETLQVGKRAIQRGGALIHTRVVQEPVSEQVTLREEHVTVERHAVDRPVSAADTAAFADKTIEVTERSEQAVVAKEARVVEEVVVGKEATERTETVTGTVRRTDVDVVEVDAADINKTAR